MLGQSLALGPSWLNPDTLLDALGAWALWGATAIIFAAVSYTHLTLPTSDLV